MVFRHRSLRRAMEELQAVGKKEEQKAKETAKEMAGESAKETGTGRAEQWKRELNEDRAEKPNILAMFLAALIIVVPVLLLAAGLMLLALWLFLGGF